MKKQEPAEPVVGAGTPQRSANPKLILALAVVGTMVACAMVAGGVMYFNGAGQPTSAVPATNVAAPAAGAADIGDFKWEATRTAGTTKPDGVQEPTSPTTPGSDTKTPPSATNPKSGNTPVAPAPPPEPVVVAPPPPPPPPPPVDHTPRIQHNGNYTPGCEGASMFLVSWHEPGEGGTSIITVDYKYDVTTEPTPTGFRVNLYVCDL